MKELRELINNAHLTKTQKIIAEYILDHASEACFMTSTEIAQTLGVSESSIIRFSRSLGFGGFMDFQKTLQKDYQDKVYSISSSITVPSQRMAHRSKTGTSSDHIHRHYKNAINNLESVFVNNSIAAFEEAADTIINSHYKYVIASRGNASLGEYFFLYLKHMLANVDTTASSVLSQVDHLCNISKDDCLIVFSFPRYSSLDEISVSMAKDAGSKIVVITDKPSALLAGYATTLLTVPVDSDTFFNSFVGAQFVAEILLDTISHKVKGIEKRLKKIDKNLEQIGNY